MSLKIFKYQIQSAFQSPIDYIVKDENGKLFIYSKEQWEEREKERNSPLQKIIRSRGGYL